MTHGEAVAAHESTYAAAMRAGHPLPQLQRHAECPRREAPKCRLCVKAVAA